MISKIIRPLFPLLLCATAVPSAQAETWHRADTANFVIFSSGKERELQRLAEKVERLDALLRMLYRIPAEPAEAKLTIYLFDRVEDVRDAAGNTGNTLHGYYQSHILGSYFVSHLEDGSKFELGAQAVLFHEYTHHFMARYFRFAYPAWYREGFAEYYATATFDRKGNWTYGRPPRYRSYDLLSRDPISIEKLLFAEPSELNRKEQLDLYARGWLLTHYMHRSKNRTDRLLAYLREVGLGGDARQAAAEHLGDLTELNDALDDYVSRRIVYKKGDNPIDYAGEISIRRLDDVSARLVELTLANYEGNNPAETREELAELAEEMPRRADVLTQLAWAEAQLAEKRARESEENADTDYSVAIAKLDEALAIDASNAKANALRGAWMLRTAESKADFAEARKYIIAANRANPNHPYPLQLYHNSFTGASGRPPRDALDGMIRAFELAPEVVDLRIELAFALANYGDYTSAISLMRILAGDPHNGHMAKELIRQLEARRDGRDYVPLPSVN